MTGISSRTFWIKRVENLLADQDLLLWLLAEKTWAIEVLFSPGNTLTVSDLDKALKELRKHNDNL